MNKPDANRARAARPFPFDGTPVRAYRFARAALWHGLFALGLRPGDEVLMPGYHHGVEVETVRALGARVRFYPLGEDLAARVEEVAAQCGPRTRAVVAIHYFGFPQPLRALLALCQARRLWLFEDCSLALLSEAEGAPLGSAGDAAAFCLYKTLPVPDGGLLVARAPAPRPWRLDLRAVRESVGWIRSRLGRVRRPPSDPHLPASDPAIEPVEKAGHPWFHPAQIGRAPSPVLPLALRALDLWSVRRLRRRNFLYWLDHAPPGLAPLHTRLPEGVCPLFFPVLCEDKKALVSAMRARGVCLHDWWSRRYGGARAGEDPAADLLRARLVGLPVHQDLDFRELERVRAALADYMPRAL